MYPTSAFSVVTTPGTGAGNVRAANVCCAEFGLSWDCAGVISACHDEGPDFDPTAAAARDRLDLRGMRTHTEMTEGVLSIESRPGHGITVQMEI